MLRKPKLYKKAITLRRKGLSYNEILKYVFVGHGTISRWCHSIPLTEKQRERLLEKKRNTPLICKLREQAIRSKKEAKIWAKEKINKLSNKDKRYVLLISGILLYWAEGARTGPQITFTNTDPRVIRIMMEFFRKILDAPEKKLRIMVRIGSNSDVSSNSDVKRAEQYWSRITGVSKKNFHPSEILKVSKNSKSIKKYPYGMCRIGIYNTSLKRRMIALIEEFSTLVLPL